MPERYTSSPWRLTGTRQSFRRDCQDDDEAGYNQSSSHEGYRDDTASAGRKLAADDIVLALKVSMEANQQRDDANGEEGRPERLAYMSKA